LEDGWGLLNQPGCERPACQRDFASDLAHSLSSAGSGRPVVQELEPEQADAALFDLYYY